ncbi:MAG TPA: hypothetical protein VLQ93_10060 [Myxococcaceae bacterium]|nr:hypothetical protein [Myxococcaceae bacterium]
MTSPQHHATPASSNDTDEGELDRILGLDPTGVYAEMDAATREQYRQACRELATWSQRTPVEAAREAIRFSEQCEAEDPRGRHVGTQLLAEGRPRLETCLGCHVPWAERAARIARRHAAGAYIGSLLGSTALALVGVERLLAVQGLEGLHRVLLVLTLALPLLELLHEGLDSVLTRMTLGLAPLPRLEPERVLSQDTRTLVVTPLLVTSPEDIEAQLRRLEIYYLGNSAPDLYFALLTDFRDAPTKELPEDRELIERL